MARSQNPKRCRLLVPGLPPKLPMEQRLVHLINLIGVDRAPSASSGVCSTGEKEFIEDPNKKLPIAAYDRRGNQYRMDFSKVAKIRGKNGVYRITYSFAEFLRENRLREGDTVVVWVLRQTASPPALEGVGNLAMVLLDYKMQDEAKLEALHGAEWHALQDVIATRGLLQLMVSGE
ncbi:hypothetical protein ABZP36_023779 [Zizania latifolia]